MKHRSLAPIVAGLTLLLGCNEPDTSTSDSNGDSTGTASTTSAPVTTGADTSTTDEPTTDEPTTAPPTTGEQLVTKRVFITSASFNGDLATQGAGADGLTGADNLCRTAATTAGVAGEWLAWVSTKDVNAGSRLAADGRWVLLDGTTEVFPSKFDLQLGPKHAIDMTEAGDTLDGGGGASIFVWTNTDRFGANSTDGINDACGDWTNQSGISAVGTVFDPNVGGQGLSWTDNKLPRPCGEVSHLYCFEV